MVNTQHTQVAIQIGSTVLVHGGLRRKHVEFGLQKMNSMTKMWLDEIPGAIKPDIIDEVSWFINVHDVGMLLCHVKLSSGGKRVYMIHYT